MAYSSHDFRDDPSYNIGSNIGYLAAFIIFASIFYFILNFFDRLPEAFSYYRVLMIVGLLYIARFIVLKFKK